METGANVFDQSDLDEIDATLGEFDTASTAVADWLITASLLFIAAGAGLLMLRRRPARG